MPSLNNSLIFSVAAFVAISCAYADKSPIGPVLTKGRGVPVCDAYLQRLNLAEYTYPPYCDRPENDQVEGFELLNRIPLTIEEAFSFGDKVRNFTQNGDQNLFSNRRSFITEAIVQTELGHTILAWRYDPPVDIDNDGKADSLFVWNGYGASHGIYKCGAIKKRDPWWQNQLAYVVYFDAMRIDQRMTKEIFGHPAGKYSITVDGKLIDLPKFRPIGTKIGIFKHKGLYYFDTFFDSWGDFQGRRQKDASIGNTLGVFLRSNGTTTQVCEYRWTKLRRANKD